MKVDIFQVKLGAKTLTFRKLSAIAILMKTGIPTDEQGNISFSEITKFAPNILKSACTTPDALEELSLLEIAQLIAAPEFVEYLTNIIGNSEQVKNE